MAMVIYKVFRLYRVTRVTQATFLTNGKFTKGFGTPILPAFKPFCLAIFHI